MTEDLQDDIAEAGSISQTGGSMHPARVADHLNQLIMKSVG